MSCTVGGSSKTCKEVCEAKKRLPRPVKKVYRKSNHLHISAPSLHSSWTYLEAVSGKLMAQNKRSEMASEMTNIVVAWDRSFWHFKSATTVSKLPAIKINFATVKSERNQIRRMFVSCYSARGPKAGPN